MVALEVVLRNFLKWQATFAYIISTVYLRTHKNILLYKARQS